VSFVLGRVSRNNLAGVHPELVRVVELAIALTTQDFRVHDGLRSKAEQRLNLARGVSRTLNSRHIVQADGLGHAVDLVPWRMGRLSWDWPGCVAIAQAVGSAGIALEVGIVWGGVWDRPLADFAQSPARIRAEAEAYVERRRAAGKSALVDGVHFELSAPLVLARRNAPSRQGDRL
jgi:peptidoglycan L-alanyl-D-glutamate endopeptidase CwlK